MDLAKDSILVVELTTAGGMDSGNGHIEAISIEGLAMVHAIVNDAVDGGFETHAMLQKAIEAHPYLASTSGVQWHRTGSGTSLQETIKEIAPKVGFCFIIAPEFGGYLEEYTLLLESLGCIVLSQPSVAVSAASDKAGALGRLSKAGIDVPATQSMEEFVAAPAIKYPVVIKPNRGAGSIGVFLVHDDAELDDAIAANERLSFPREGLIVQEFIKGTPLSASAIAAPTSTELLSINEQDVSLSVARLSESKYRGGVVGPLHADLTATCDRISQLIARDFQMCGYFGFDFILSRQGTPVVVEINPRLTTSFAGLKMLHPESVLRFIADSKEHKGVKMPWASQGDFLAYRVVELPGSITRSAKSKDLQKDRNVISMIMPGGETLTFIAARGQTRKSAIDSLDRLVGQL